MPAASHQWNTSAVNPTRASFPALLKTVRDAQFAANASPPDAVCDAMWVAAVAAAQALWDAIAIASHSGQFIVSIGGSHISGVASLTVGVQRA